MGRMFTRKGWIVIIIFIVVVGSVAVAGFTRWYHDRLYERVLIEIQNSLYLDEPTEVLRWDFE